MVSPEFASRWQLAASKLQAPYPTLAERVGEHLRIGWDKYLPVVSTPPGSAKQPSHPPVNRRGEKK